MAVGSETADIADGKTVVEVVINAVAKTKGENVFAVFIFELVAVFLHLTFF